MKFWLWIAFFASSALALPGVERMRMVSPHFEYVVATEDSAEARSIAQMAEVIWDSLSHATGFQPPTPVSIVIRDEDDYSNGYAIPFRNWVSIWLAPLDFEFRNGTRWRANVLAHELAHVFTMRALGFTSWYLGHDFGADFGLDHGNVLASSSIRSDDLETWMAEGLAQYGAERCGVDHWDAQRAMLERVAWLSGAIQPYPKLVSFSGDSRESEGIYNQGYSFIRFVMAHGSLDLASLLRVGKASGIRTAVAQAFSQDFALVFEKWRSDLRAKYGDPVPSIPGSSWVKAPYRLEYMKATSPVQVGSSRYFLSSHQNDYGITHLYEIDAAGSLSLVDEDVEGRLFHDSIQKQLLYVKMGTGLNRRSIRDLFALDLNPASPDFGNTKALTVSARVVDASANAQGVWYVGRRNGSNRLFRMQNSQVQEQMASPPGLELISVAPSFNVDVLYLGFMGLGGYSLARYSVTEKTWQPILKGLEVRDPWVQDGFLYFSHVQNGAWQIGRTSDPWSESNTVTVLTQEVGGAFQPSVEQGVLAYSAYTAQGFVPRQVSMEASESREAILPLEEKNPAEDPLFSKNPAMVKTEWGSANSLALLGFATQSFYLRSRPAAGDSVALGDKVLLGGAVVFADPSQENYLTLQVQALKGAGGLWGKSGWDPILMANWQSSSWAPLLNLSMGYQQITPEYGPFPAPDFSVNLVSTFGEASLQFTLSNHWYALGIARTESEGLGIGSEVWSIMQQDQVLGGFAYSNTNPGRYGTLSGLTLSLLGGYVKIGAVDFSRADDLDYAGGLVPHKGWVILPTIQGNSHLSRTLLFGMSFSPQIIGIADTLISSYQVEGNVGIPFPRGHISIPVWNRHLTWVDPILRLGFVGINHGDDSTETTVSQSRHIQGMRGATSAPHYATSPEDLTPWSLKRSQDLEVNAELSCRVLTLGHATSSWALGVNLPLEKGLKPGTPIWYLGLSF
jgi:hypothetical protein